MKGDKIKKDGIEVTLTQSPYIDTKIHGFDHITAYWAHAVDEEENDYEVYWEITNEEAEDEGDACDWDEFEIIKI